MRRHLLYLALAAVVVLTAGASSTFAARGSGSILYLFNGRLLADAGNSPTLYVDVNGGNHAALRKLIGQRDDQQFAVGANTQYIRWTNGVPTVVQESNLAAGDRVTVRVRAARDASLAGPPRTTRSRCTSRTATSGRCARCSDSRSTRRSATTGTRSSSSGRAACRP